LKKILRLICLSHSYFGCYFYCHTSVLLCAAYTPVCSHSVCFLGVRSICNREEQWIQHDNNYNTAATHNMHYHLKLHYWNVQTET